jgi:5'-nucleotidase
LNILVSNDDGIMADGLRTLVKALADVPGNNVYVSAPDGQRSACGHGITMTAPIFVCDGIDIEGAVWAQSISGTPADCVKFGIKRLKKEKNIEIDAVFSGINHGGNIGSDVFYSGTLSAAIEGVLCGVPGVALSIGTNFPTADMLGQFSTIIRQICEKALPDLDNKTVLNINYPPIPPSEIKGLKVTRMGPREYAERFDLLENPKGQKYYWYCGDMVVYNDLPNDYDVIAQQDGYVSVTPLRFDLTDYEMREKIKNWKLEI